MILNVYHDHNSFLFFYSLINIFLLLVIRMVINGIKIGGVDCQWAIPNASVYASVFKETKRYSSLFMKTYCIIFFFSPTDPFGNSELDSFYSKSWFNIFPWRLWRRFCVWLSPSRWLHLSPAIYLSRRFYPLGLFPNFLSFHLSSVYNWMFTTDNRVHKNLRQTSKSGEPGDSWVYGIYVVKSVQ